MNRETKLTETFFAKHSQVIRVSLSTVLGSSPREEGVEMLIAVDGLLGTIGGGKLEFIAIERAQKMLEANEKSAIMDVPLGPEIGQCCGGRVEISLTRMKQADKMEVLNNLQAEFEEQPHVYVMGAGHVGRALADLLQHLPVKTILVDMRSGELALCDANVEKQLIAIPEFIISSAPPASTFIIATHDHALDFLITSAALELGNAAYVGMIGSSTKRAKFKNWCNENYKKLSIDELICPIGNNKSNDKRPSVIAAFVVAEVLAKLSDDLQKRQMANEEYAGQSLPFRSDGLMSTLQNVKCEGTK